MMTSRLSLYHSSYNDVGSAENEDAVVVRVTTINHSDRDDHMMVVRVILLLVWIDINLNNRIAQATHTNVKKCCS